jgi:hypothetical protein
MERSFPHPSQRRAHRKVSFESLYMTGKSEIMGHSALAMRREVRMTDREADSESRWIIILLV